MLCYALTPALSQREREFTYNAATLFLKSKLDLTTV